MVSFFSPHQELLKSRLVASIAIIGTIQIFYSVLFSLDITNAYANWVQNYPLWIPHIPKTDIVSGTIFQKNHFSTLLILFSIVLCNLISQNKIKIFLAWIGFGTCAFFLAQGASRLVLIQLIAILILMAVRSLIAGKPFRPLKIYSLFFAVAVSFQIIFSIFSETEEHSAIQRFQNNSLTDYRWTLWSQSWDQILKNPFTGSGIGQFAKNRTETQAFLPLENINLSSEMYHHSHMWILQILMEHGLILGGILIVLLLGLLATAFKNSIQRENDWALWLSAWVIFIHSFTEYPLWYVSFFMLFFFCLSLVLPNGKTWQLHPRFRLVIQTAVLALVIGSCVTIYQYINLMGAYYQKNRPSAQPTPGINNPLLEPVAEFYKLVMTAELNDIDLAEKIKLCERVKSARPVEYVFFKCSIFYAYSGNIPAALDQLQSAYHMYPQSAHKIYTWISQPNIEKDPRLEVLKFRLKQMILSGT